MLVRQVVRWEMSQGWDTNIIRIHLMAQGLNI